MRFTGYFLEQHQGKETVGQLVRLGNAICKTPRHSACAFCKSPISVAQSDLRYTPAYPALAIQTMLDPRRMVRWVWLGRAALACSILVAAVFVWDKAEPEDTLVATLSFACAVLATVASAMYAEVYGRPVGRLFYALQCLVDLLVVTAVVHITGGWSSQFAALYILVIATAALMLPFLQRCASAGLHVLIGDPNRRDLPLDHLTENASYPVGDVGDARASAERIGHVYELRAKGPTPPMSSRP